MSRARDFSQINIASYLTTEDISDYATVSSLSDYATVNSPSFTGRIYHNGDQYGKHTCAELGISGGGGGTADCGECIGTDGSIDGCAQGTGASYNWFNAKLYCEKAGMRLCTRDEINAGAAKGTGCSHDSRAIWTSTLDTASGKYWVVQGNNSGGSAEILRYPYDASTGTGFSLDEFGIRCCGQNSWG